MFSTSLSSRKVCLPSFPWIHRQEFSFAQVTPVYWQSFVSTCDVFNCLFLLDVWNEIQLKSRVICYSWLVCLLGVWLRNMSLVKVGNLISDGIDSFLVFHLVWLKSLKRFWPYLIAFRSCISNGKPEKLLYLCLYFMKPSTVYEASLCTFELRFEIMIWPIVWGLI